MGSEQRYFLSSMDSLIFEEPRECVFNRKIHFDTGKEAVIATLDPPVQLQYGGSWTVVRDVILTARHEGHGLLPITYFPCFVYVASLVKGDISEAEQVSGSQLEIIGIAELYRTEKDARDHVFDKE
jgi:hypothetical protein